MTKESKESFGLTTPLGRAGQPVEIATSFVFLASADSSYITFVSPCLFATPSRIFVTDVLFVALWVLSGQVFHVNGGSIIN